MPGVVVEVPGQHMLVTDAQGRYSTMLSVSDDSLTCYFSYYGYRDTVFVVAINTKARIPLTPLTDAELQKLEASDEDVTTSEQQPSKGRGKKAGGIPPYNARTPPPKGSKGKPGQGLSHPPPGRITNKNPARKKYGVQWCLNVRTKPENSDPTRREGSYHTYNCIVASVNGRLGFYCLDRELSRSVFFTSSDTPRPDSALVELKHGSIWLNPIYRDRSRVHTFGNIDYVGRFRGLYVHKWHWFGYAW